MTLRALCVLKEADYILAEDTRKTGVMLKHFEIKKPLISFYEHNETQKIPWVIEELKRGKNFALVSNAGVPTISDPGYKLIRECRKESLAFTSLPGASSIVNALAMSTLARDKFIFLGYLPRKKNERRKLLEKIPRYAFSVVFFESPFRILNSLRDLREIIGNARITVAREMTKKFEEVLEVTLEEAIRHFQTTPPRGEFTLVLESERKNHG